MAADPVRFARAVAIRARQRRDESLAARARPPALAHAHATIAHPVPRAAVGRALRGDCAVRAAVARRAEAAAAMAHAVPGTLFEMTRPVLGARARLARGAAIASPARVAEALPASAAPPVTVAPIQRHAEGNRAICAREARFTAANSFVTDPIPAAVVQAPRERERRERGELELVAPGAAVPKPSGVCSKREQCEQDDPSGLRSD